MKIYFNFLNLKLWTFRFILIIPGVLFIVVNPANSQIIHPTQPDLVLDNAPNAQFINCDMLSTPSGPLRAFSVYFNGSLVIKVQDNVGGSGTVSIPNAGQYADIALTTSTLSSDSVYRLAVVGTLGNNVYLNTYLITGVGSGFSLGLLHLTTIQLNATGTIGDFPRIDIFADINNILFGFPSMHKFIISWTEDNGSLNTAKAAYGDITNPSSFTTFSTGLIINRVWDIAASFNQANSINYAYILSKRGTDLILLQLNCSTSSITNTYLTPLNWG